MNQLNPSLAGSNFQFPKIGPTIIILWHIIFCSLLILGIDPGYATTGFGLIDYLDDQIKVVDFGTINTTKDLPQSERIRQTVDDLLELIKEFEPDEVALEELFFSKNVKTALKVAECRGAIIYALSRQKISLTEYKPNQIKSNICGNGSAPKIQVQKMVQMLLKLKQLPQPDDAADALALAICHAHHQKQKLIPLND